MTVTDPSVIQELVISSPRKLKDIAKKHGIAVSRAVVVRNHWVRRITSHCVQCNCLVRGEACPQCKTVKQSALEFLQKIKPKDVALRRYCTHCGVPFYYSAGYILSSFRKSGVFKPSSSCDRCRFTKAPSKKWRPNKKRVAKRVKPIQAKRPAPKKRKEPTKKEAVKPSTLRHEDSKGAGPLHQPFAALGGLKLKKQQSGLA